MTYDPLKARLAMQSNVGVRPKVRRNRDRPASQLAEQSLRPVEELIGWLESGQLRGYKNEYGEWMVWGSQLDRWRELLKESRS